MADKKRPSAKRSEKSAGGILGQLPELRPIRSVQKNPWNANRMTPHTRASLKHGLQTDGWVASQALLVWGLDGKGKARNLIIDGEHRWEVASELGTFDLVPMVVLDGLSEAQAKAWTLKLARHGDPQQDLLAQLVNDLSANLDVPDLGMEIGIEDERLMGFLSFQDAAGVPEAPAGAGLESGPERTASRHTRLVQLFFDAAQHEQWQEAVRQIAKATGKDNVSEAALEGALRAAAALEQRPSSPPKVANGGARRARAAGSPA